MFAVGKKVTISPDYVDNQYNMWEQQVLGSSKIFIIGVRHTKWMSIYGHC